MTTCCLPLRLLDCFGFKAPPRFVPNFSEAPMTTDGGLWVAFALVFEDPGVSRRGAELRKDVEVTVTASIRPRGTSSLDSGSKAVTGFLYYSQTVTAYRGVGGGELKLIIRGLRALGVGGSWTRASTRLRNGKQKRAEMGSHPCGVPESMGSWVFILQMRQFELAESSESMTV